MKNKIVLILAFLALISCKDESKKTDLESSQERTNIAVSDNVLESAVIYEANIRQYSPEGTFAAFTKDIPKLKELGVKIIWLMPIHPISEEKRKATGDTLVVDIQNIEDRKKYLGSPYAVQDYKKVNPDFGTIEDFRALVDTAHQNEMFVIIDWVPNHTGWDHAWISQHSEYYTKDAEGNITDPLNDKGEKWGWTDVADLDYGNEEMRTAMIDAMKHWITVEEVDGFRCDVAHGVPQSFWEKAIPVLRAEKHVFMLAEAELPNIMTKNLFEMSYAWERHHLLNAIAKGEKNVSHFDTHMKSSQEKWEKDDILMNFITNHDENAWAGPVKERMGEASETLLALTYCLPGMPLVYSGQEYDLNHRLKFFEKDSIPKEKGKTWPVLAKLGTLKNEVPALAGGKHAASYERIATGKDETVLAFKRVKGESELIYMANLKAEDDEFYLPETGAFLNAISGETEELNNANAFKLPPWGYKILIKK